MDQKRFDLEKRLINFAVRNIRLAEHLPNTKTGNHIRGQLLRCGTSPAPNYAEAQSAESKPDFIHKIKIVLKELRETKVWLLITAQAALVKPQALLEPIIQECDELISIFVKSVQTASSTKRFNS
jgi:four helix bundle protein